jgi:type IV pilus assembly protein PilO
MQLGLNKLSWYSQILLFAVVSGLGIFAYHDFCASKVAAEIAAKGSELVRERAEIARGRTAEARLADFRAEVSELETRFAGLKAVLPEQRDVGEMLRRIQTLATQSSLVVKVFRPQAVTNKELHQEWPMTIELEGTYHSLGRFFEQVSKVPRIINVGNINIKGREEKERSEEGPSITALCTATTFVLLDKPAEPASAAGKRPARAARQHAPGQ